MSVLYRRACINDAEAIAQVHCESWRSTYPGLVPTDVIEAWADPGKRTAAWRTIIGGAPQSLWLAEQDGRIAGFASGGGTRGAEDGCDSQLFAVYLAAAVQRRGIGRALVAMVFADLLDRNYTSTRVEVMKGNAPAISFYERLGAQRVREAAFEMSGHALTEIIYRWPVLPRLNSDA